MEGKYINEASYGVGFNDPARINREYNRQFCLSPSSTPAAAGA